MKNITIHHKNIISNKDLFNFQITLYNFKKYIMNIICKKNNSIKEIYLRFLLRKTTLMGRLEALIVVRPWIPENIYSEQVRKIVKKIGKLNEKHNVKEDIIVSGVLFSRNCG